MKGKKKTATMNKRTSEVLTLEKRDVPPNSIDIIANIATNFVVESGEA